MRVLIVWFLAAGLSAGQGEIARHLWSDAMELRSRHYVVETNTFPEVARSLSERLEEAYTLFQDRFGVLTGRAARRMRVKLFRTSAEYMTLGEGVKGAIGHFDAAKDRCALAWRGGPDLTGWPIAIHEACHHYFRRRFPHLTVPSWYAEGVSCYFEGLQDVTTKNGVSRVRVRTAKRALKDGVADLQRLLDARARVVAGELRIDAYKPVRYYALSWSLVHFLASDSHYRQGFRRFELRLFSSAPFVSARPGYAKQLLTEECGDLGALERAWRRHLKKLQKLSTPRGQPVYAWEVTSQRAWVRHAALSRLSGRNVPAEIVPAVRACLRDLDVIVRTDAVRIMARRMDERTASDLLPSLDLGDKDLKRATLQALAHPSAAVAVPRLLRETDDPRRALEALAGIGDPRGYRTLREGLLTRGLPSATRARCAGALGHHRDDMLYLRLAQDDPARSVRIAAQAALLRLSKLTAPADLRKILDVTVLIDTLSDAHIPDRSKSHACTLLGMVDAKDAIPALRRLCTPKHDDTVRLAAARALVKLTGETRGFEAGQRARDREAALRRWAPDG